MASIHKIIKSDHSAVFLRESCISGRLASMIVPFVRSWLGSLAPSFEAYIENTSQSTFYQRSLRSDYTIPLVPTLSAIQPAAMAPRNLSPAGNDRMQQYFTNLAPSYTKSTGNTTYSVVEQVLNEVKLGINGNSLIHDNGCGDGTATAAVLDFCASRAITLPKITATDCNEAMIEATQKRKSEAGSKWSNVTAEVQDSHQLTFQDDLFHYSFCNISINTFAQPLKVLKEILRTLRPGGIAVVSIWKRFGVADVMRNAQIKVKGEEFGGVKPEGADMTKEGVIAHLMYISGWELGKLKTLQKDVLVKEGTPEMNDLKQALLEGKEFAWIRADWSDEENAKWPQALDEAMKEEIAEHGGLLLEAWVTLGRKWDALYG